MSKTYRRGEGAPIPSTSLSDIDPEHYTSRLVLPGSKVPGSLSLSSWWCPYCGGGLIWKDRDRYSKCKHPSKVEY